MGIAVVLSKTAATNIGLAVLKFVVTAALCGYRELAKFSSALQGLVFVILCPPSVLSKICFIFKPDTEI
jgi:hypothetical protein